MASEAEDWSAVLDRLIAGDAAAYLRFSRLVTGCLIQLRAYDFQEEWDDLRQDILAAVVSARREGRLHEAEAYVAYVRAVTRNKVFDRIKRRLRQHERETLPWEDATEPASEDAADPVLRSDLEAALASLPDEERRLVVGVYVEGHSYPEMSRNSGVPLGTLKRRLRDGLSRLRAQLGAGEPSRQADGAISAPSDPLSTRRKTSSP